MTNHAPFAPTQFETSPTSIDRNNRERGDVPGWVLVTLMTAGLAVGIWALAAPALEGLFNNAIDSVTAGIHN